MAEPRTEPLLPQLRAARGAGAAGPAAAAAAALQRGGRGEGAAGPAGSQVPLGGGCGHRLPPRAAHARADVSPAHRQRAELEELRQQLEESSAAEGRALRAEFEKGREEQERRHQVGVPPSPPLLAPALWGAPVLGVAAPLQTLRLGRAGRGGGGSWPALTVPPAPQMEMKALKEQLEAERQMWEANCAKKEVRPGKQPSPSCPAPQALKQATCGFPLCGLPVGTVLGFTVWLLGAWWLCSCLRSRPFSEGGSGRDGSVPQPPFARGAALTMN